MRLVCAPAHLPRNLFFVLNEVTILVPGLSDPCAIHSYTILRKLLHTFIGKLLIHIRPHIVLKLIAVNLLTTHDLVARTRIELVFTG